MKKENFYNKKRYSWIYIVIIIFFADIFSKYWIFKHFSLYQIKKIFFICNIFYVHNYGAAFSLLSNQNGWQKWLFSLISIITILNMIYVNITEQKKNDIISYSFIIGGAIGNLFDRVFYGCVIDFIDLHIDGYHFATFNIADLSIFIGVTIIIMKKYVNNKK
ncbi:signal peptidase II [Buchnera aphidicola]|uniref:signal peptidase II n=1 Tax=Buchnera aphidicola TaxID=9 RepID=UPI0034641D76